MKTAAISTNDIVALQAILQYYGHHVACSVTLSAKRGEYVDEVSHLIVKLSCSDAILLTFGDLEHIKMALRTFITRVRQKVPASHGRDGILESSERLLCYFSKGICSKCAGNAGRACYH